MTVYGRMWAAEVGFGNCGRFHPFTKVFGSGRVPINVRLSVHPDFLSGSLALTNFMRLSLMKAANASVGGAPYRKSGTMGRKRRAQPFQRFCSLGKRLRARARVLVQWSESIRKIRFRPMYAGANIEAPVRFPHAFAAIGRRGQDPFGKMCEL